MGVGEEDSGRLSCAAAGFKVASYSSAWSKKGIFVHRDCRCREELLRWSLFCRSLHIREVDWVGTCVAVDEGERDTV